MERVTRFSEIDFIQILLDPVTKLLYLSRVDDVDLVHDGMPKGQLHGRDEAEDAFVGLLGDPALDEGEVGAEAHAGGDGVAVEHACGELVAGRPRVAVSVGSALVGFPEVAVLGFDVRVQGLADYRENECYNWIELMEKRFNLPIRSQSFSKPASQD